MNTGIQYDANTVAKTLMVDGVAVFTVALPFDHNPGNAPSHWYETMVFGGVLSGEQDRYSTREEAYDGHERMVQRVLAATEGVVKT